MSNSARSDELERAFLSLGAVWLALLAQPLAAVWIGTDASTVLCFLIATGIVVVPAFSLDLAPSDAMALVAGLIGGAGLRWVAITLGPGPIAPGGEQHSAMLARHVLAPLFEEILYRERLMVPLHRRFGAAVAILVTSGLFALPHLSPVLIAQVFVIGLGLGAARIASGSVALCVGLHAGWNLALASVHP